VSSDGGHDAVWSRDGKELLFRSGPRMLSARVAPGVTFRADAPEVLFDGGFDPTVERVYDVAPDGRFVMFERGPRDDTASASIVMVLNWFNELKQRVPVK